MNAQPVVWRRSPEQEAYVTAAFERMDQERGSSGFPEQDLRHIERVVALRARPSGAAPVQSLLDAVANAATIDIDVPTASKLLLAGGVKLGMKRLMSWYVGYLAQQVTALGGALVRFGRGVSVSLDDLDARASELRRDVDELHRRVVGPDDPGSEH